MRPSIRLKIVPQVLVALLVCRKSDLWYRWLWFSWRRPRANWVSVSSKLLRCLIRIVFTTRIFPRLLIVLFRMKRVGSPRLTCFFSFRRKIILLLTPRILVSRFIGIHRSRLTILIRLCRRFGRLRLLFVLPFSKMFWFLLLRVPFLRRVARGPWRPFRAFVLMKLCCRLTLIQIVRMLFPVSRLLAPFLTLRTSLLTIVGWITLLSLR